MCGVVVVAMLSSLCMFLMGCGKMIKWRQEDPNSMYVSSTVWSAECKISSRSCTPFNGYSPRGNRCYGGETVKLHLVAISNMEREHFPPDTKTKSFHSTKSSQISPFFVLSLCCRRPSIYHICARIDFPVTTSIREPCQPIIMSSDPCKVGLRKN
jgi:hypothetical protein